MTLSELGTLFRTITGLEDNFITDAQLTPLFNEGQYELQRRTEFLETENIQNISANVSRYPAPSNMMKLLRVEMAEENTAQGSSANDFSASVWTASNVSVSANSAVAPDGTTTADTLTSSASNGTITQTLTLASASYRMEVWLRRLTGSGSVDLTLDNTVYTTVTLTTAWQLFTITGTVTDPVFGVRIQTSGDAVYAWGANLRSGIMAYEPLTETDQSELDLYGTAWQSDTGVPSHFYLDAGMGQIVLWGTPTTDVPNGLRIEYVYRPTALSATTDVPQFPQDIHVSLVHYAIAEVMTRDNEPQTAMLYTKKFDDVCERFRRQRAIPSHFKRYVHRGHTPSIGSGGAANLGSNFPLNRG